MFNNRYITKGINEQTPRWIQNLLWYMIDTLEDPKDYLQVFLLSIKEGQQSIVHTQEEPVYEKEHLLDCTQPITAKIYVIDDKTHCTMLLSEEY